MVPTAVAPHQYFSTNVKNKSIFSESDWPSNRLAFKMHEIVNKIFMQKNVSFSCNVTNILWQKLPIVSHCCIWCQFFFLSGCLNSELLCLKKKKRKRLKKHTYFYLYLFCRSHHLRRLERSDFRLQCTFKNISLWLHVWLHSSGGKQWPKITRERRQTEKQALSATNITQSHSQAMASVGKAIKQTRMKLRIAN